MVKTPFATTPLTKKWVLLFLFALLLTLGLYFRFYRIEDTLYFSFDQGRDAFAARDIVQGRWHLLGPKTGVGNMHLGPLYFYFLAPFYYATNLDPSASNYGNILLNVFNFVVLFLVTRKLYSTKAAFFVLFVYTCSNYLINLNKVAWNVTPIPGLALLIFYSIYQIYQKQYRWVFVLATLVGIYFHIHFTAVFLPPIIAVSMLFVKEKGKVLKYALLSLPFCVIWLLPNIYVAATDPEQKALTTNFFATYLMPFHLRFFFVRLPDSLVQFHSILFFSWLYYLKYLLPIVFTAVLFWEKDSTKKRIGFLLLPWFFVPLFGFTLYSGSISDYYFLSTVPFVLFILWYLQKKLFLLPLPKLLTILILFSFWSYYTYANTKDQWIKIPASDSLTKQRDKVKQDIFRGEVISYREGGIRSYFFELYSNRCKEATIRAKKIIINADSPCHGQVIP